MGLQWSNDLSTGIIPIDDQHKEIIRRVNAFLAAMEAGKGKMKVVELMEFLSRYIVQHFHDEEFFMANERYDEFKAHKEQHMQFIKDFHAMEKEFETHGITTDLVIQTQQKVCDWLANHISKEDRKIVQFIKNNQ
ncbi:MAG: bacteriohemerythrin [Planctomycetes bacterium]|nr:bacteriohemerythrin [Planctomycetota bacterium]